VILDIKHSPGVTFCCVSQIAKHRLLAKTKTGKENTGTPVGCGTPKGRHGLGLEGAILWLISSSIMHLTFTVRQWVKCHHRSAQPCNPVHHLASQMLVTWSGYHYIATLQLTVVCSATPHTKSVLSKMCGVTGDDSLDCRSVYNGTFVAQGF
jgi:hypothetical protein